MTNEADWIEINEPALVEVARNDPNAFTVLYRHYLTPLYRYLLSRSNNIHVAEDLLNRFS